MKNTFYIDVQANLRSSTISYIGYEDGERVHETVPFRPKLYVHCNEETTHKTITGEIFKNLNLILSVSSMNFVSLIQVKFMVTLDS